MPPPGQRSGKATLLEWLGNNRQHVYTTCGAALAAYLAYKAYHSETASKTSSQVQKLVNSIQNLSSTLSSLGASGSLVATDLHAFLSSNGNDLPQSLKQLNKLLQSQEVQQTISSAAASVARGVSNATASTSEPGSQPVLDKVLEAILSDRGRSLVGLAVGIATKNATAGLCEYLERMQQASDPSTSSMSANLGAIVNLLASEQGERVLSVMITKSIRTAVSTYVDATTGYNVYDDMVASIAKQEHRDAVSEIMTRVTAAFCREVVLAYKKSRTSANIGSGSSSRSSSSGNLSTHSTVTLSSTSPPTTDGVSVERKHSLDGPQPVACRAGPPQRKHNAPKPPSPMWLKQVVDLAKEQEVRTFAVDVVKSATREATKGALETLFQSSSDSHSYLGLAGTMSGYRLYVMLTVAISLLMYAMAPHTIIV